MKQLLWMLLGVAISCGISIPVSKEIALRIPVERQVAVIDMKAFARSFSDKDIGNPENVREFNRQLSQVKAYAKTLADQGIVVVDSMGVIAAPDDAYIDVSKKVK